jgi:hypothetical protein
MMDGVEKLLRSCVAKLPPQIVGPLAWRLLPGRRDGFGGPFNGQRGRAEIFRQILQCESFQAIVETGTFHGTTTVFLHETSGLPTYTVEAVPLRFYYARQRLRSHGGIHLEMGDSCSFLERLGKAATLRGCVFFYLDAHWYEDLPLAHELRLIAKMWQEPVVMVDDFEVPDDPEYGFDDYGGGKRLTLGYLPKELLSEFCSFWPAMRGRDESGRRRGCIVLCRRGAMAEKLKKLQTLRIGTPPTPTA